jgi:hypothetical protein
MQNLRNNLIKNCLLIVNYGFIGYMVCVFTLKVFVLKMEDLPPIISYFSFILLGFWAGALFMAFIYRSRRKNSNDSH